MNFLTPNWPAPARIKAYTTLRSAWGNSANVKSSDSEHTLQTLLQLPEKPFWINQTHSAIAIEAIEGNQHQTADASFTSAIHRVCIVLTADCLPILICNQQGTQVAAIHAGWRGLASGIIETTLQSLSDSGENLLAWLGPAIGPQKFEVGNDVLHAFTSKQPEALAAFNPVSQDKWLADLYQLATLRLKSFGITHIYGGSYCTYTQPDLFFSYRRDQGKTGRMASLIWIDS